MFWVYLENCVSDGLNGDKHLKMTELMCKIKGDKGATLSQQKTLCNNLMKWLEETEGYTLLVFL